MPGFGRFSDYVNHLIAQVAAGDGDLPAQAPGASDAARQAYGRQVASQLQTQAGGEAGPFSPQAIAALNAMQASRQAVAPAPSPGPDPRFAALAGIPLPAVPADMGQGPQTFNLGGAGPVQFDPSQTQQTVQPPPLGVATDPGSALDPVTDLAKALTPDVINRDNVQNAALGVPFLDQAADLAPELAKLGPLSAEMVRNPNWQNAIDLLGQGARGSNQAIWELNPLNIAVRAVGAPDSPAEQLKTLLGAPKALRHPKQAGLGLLEEFNKSPYGTALNAQSNAVLGALGDTVNYGLTGQGNRPLGFLPGDLDLKLAAAWWGGNLLLADQDNISPEEAIQQTVDAHRQGGGAGAATYTMGLSGKGHPGALGFLSTIIQQTLADPVTWETAGAAPLEGWLSTTADEVLARSRVAAYAAEHMTEAERTANFGSKGVRGLSGSELAEFDGRAVQAGSQPSPAAVARAGAAKGVAELIGSGKALAEAPERALSTAVQGGFLAAKQLPVVGPLIEHIAAPSARTLADEALKMKKSAMAATKKLGGPIDARRAQAQAAETALVEQAVGAGRAQVGDYGNDAVVRYTTDGNDLVVVLNNDTRPVVQKGIGQTAAKRAATQLNDELVASRTPLAEDVAPAQPAQPAAQPAQPATHTVTVQDALGRPVTREVPIPTGPIPGGGLLGVNGDRFFSEQPGTVIAPKPPTTAADLLAAVAAHRAATPNWEETVSGYRVMKGNVLGVKHYGEVTPRPLVVDGRTVQAPNAATAAQVVKHENQFLANLGRDLGAPNLVSAAGGAPETGFTQPPIGVASRDNPPADFAQPPEASAPVDIRTQDQIVADEQAAIAEAANEARLRQIQAARAAVQPEGTVLTPDNAQILDDLRGMRDEAEATVSGLEAEPSAAQSRELYDAKRRLGDIQSRINQHLTGQKLPLEVQLNPPRGPLPAEAKVRLEGDLPPVTAAPSFPTIAELRAQAQADAVAAARNGYVPPETTAPGVFPTRADPTADLAAFGDGTPAQVNPPDLPPLAERMVQPLEQARGEVANRSEQEFQAIARIEPLDNHLVVVDTAGNRQILPSPVPDPEVAAAVAGELNTWVHEQHAPISPPGVAPVPQVGPLRGTATAATAGGPSFAAEGEPVLPGDNLGYMHPKPNGKRAVDAVPELGRDQPNAARRFWDRYSPQALARDAQQKAIEGSPSLRPAAKAVENAVTHQEHMVNDFAAAYRDEFGTDPPITAGTSKKQIEKQSVNNLLEVMLWDPNEAHRARAFNEIKRRASPVRKAGKTALADQGAIAERMDRIRALYQTENTRRLGTEAIAGRTSVPGQSAQFSTDPDVNAAYRADELQWAADHHVISQAEADGLNEMVTVKYTDTQGREVTTEERLIDAKQRHKANGASEREAENLVLQEIEDAVPRAERPRMTALGKLWRGYLKAESKLTRFVKDKNLYGYRKVIPGTFWDVTEGVLRRGMNGQFDSIAAAASPKNIVAGFRATKENAGEYFHETPDGMELARYGGDDQSFVHHGGRQGDTGVPALQFKIDKLLAGHPGQKLGKLVAGYFGSENGQALRNTMDGVFRFSDYMAGFRTQIASAKPQFFRAVGGAAERAQLPASDLRVFRQSLGDAFSAWDVERLAKEAGFSDGVAGRLAGEWQGHVNEASRVGKARMNEVSFDLGARNADEYARHLWLYHFWMTRASPYYLKSALRNPALFRFYNTFLDDMHAACEESGGQKCGYLQVAKIAGMSTLVPGGFLLSTALLNLEPDQASKPNATMFDKIFNNPAVPLQLKPVLQAEAYVVGLTQKHGDVVGMNADVGDLTSAWNLATSQGWIDGKSMQPNAMRKWQNAFFDSARALVDRATPGDLSVPHIDETAGDKRAISQLMVSNVAQAHGIGPDEDITTWVTKYPEAWKEIKDAELDFSVGSDKNEVVNDAIADYYAGGAVRQATAWAIPAIIAESSQGVLDRQAIKKNVPTYGSFAAQGARSQLPELGSPEDVRLWAEQTEQRSLRTNPDTGGNTAYGLADDIFNEIVYSDTPVTRVVGDKSYSRQDILAMSYDERKALALGVLTESGLADKYAQLDADEKLFRALPGNEDIAAYQKWRTSWLAADGGVPAMREATAAGNPSYRAYIDQLPDEIKNNPDRLDQASTSPDAYLALYGKKSSTFDESLPTRDQENIPYDAAATGGNGTGTGFPQLNRGQQVARDQAKYQLEQAQARGYLYQFTGDPDFVLENTNPQLRTALINRLRAIGITPPTMPTSVRRYETWKLGKKPGEDTSLAAYTAEGDQMDAILAAKGYDFNFVLDVLASQNGVGLDMSQVLPSMPPEYGVRGSPGVGNLLGQRYAGTVDSLLGGDGRRSAGVDQLLNSGRYNQSVGQLLGGSQRYSPSVGEQLGGGYSDTVDQLLSGRRR